MTTTSKLKTEAAGMGRRLSYFWENLGLLFIALKLMGYINWHWIYVLAPIWVPLALGLAVFVSLVVTYTLASLFDRWANRTD